MNTIASATLLQDAQLLFRFVGRAVVVDSAGVLHWDLTKAISATAATEEEATETILAKLGSPLQLNSADQTSWSIVWDLRLDALEETLSTAELKAQALEEAATAARAAWAPAPCPWVGFLDDRAALIRAGLSV